MRFTLIDALEILIVSFAVYRLMLNLRGTRASAIIKGLVLLVIASGISRLVGLRTISWLLEQGTTVIMVALPVVFYPELRRTLERLGRGSILRAFTSLEREQVADVTEQITRAVRWCAANKVGALIVVEREVGLDEYVETGVRIDAAVSAELLMTLFFPKTALHDGAVIIRGDRVVAAGCFLPLSDAATLAPDLGTRHRAAVGVSEETDAFVIVVSEETGTISVAGDGHLERGLSDDDLRRRLRAAFEPEAVAAKEQVAQRLRRLKSVRRKAAEEPAPGAKRRLLKGILPEVKKQQRATVGMRLFAVGFSVVLWLLAPRPQVPESDRVPFVERPMVSGIEVRGLAEGLAVVDKPGWVTVHLRSLDPEAVIDVDRVQAYVDLTGRGAGVHTVPVTVVPPFGVQVARVDPPAVDVRVENVVRASLPVRVAAVGLSPDVRVDVLPPEPPLAQVEGPAGRVSQVAELIATVRIGPGFGTQVAEAAVQAVNAAGAVVSGVRTTPERVTVKVVVTPEPPGQGDAPLPEPGAGG